MRANRRWLARAKIRERGSTQGVRIGLALARDGAYRWYEEANGADTEVSCDTYHGALQAAEDAWGGFWSLSALTESGIKEGFSA